jgi:hypothetical protein
MTYPEAFGKVFFNPNNLCFYGIMQSDESPNYYMLINLSRMRNASGWSKGRNKLPKYFRECPNAKFTVVQQEEGS